MRRFSFLMAAAAVTLGGCAKSKGPAPSASATSVASADVPEGERIKWTGTQAEVKTLTPRARTELQTHKPAVTSIMFAHDATQQDIEALRDAKLHALHSLHIVRSPKVTDLAPLATLQTLRQVDVSDTGVTTLAPLAKLPKLSIVSFGTEADRSAPWPAPAPAPAPAGSAKKPGAPASAASAGSAGSAIPDAPPIPNKATPGAAVEVDLGDVPHAPSLRRLFLHGVTTKLEALRGSPITTLGLSRMHVDDPAPIASLAALDELRLMETSVPGVDWIGKLPKLRRLTVTNVRLDSLDFVAPLVDLTSLSAGENPRVTSLAPLAKLTKLTIVQLDQTSVEDLAPLSGLTSLSVLNVSKTRVQSLAPLAAITTLTTVTAADTGVHDLAPLRASTKLTSIEIPKAVTDADVDALKKAAPNVRVTR